MEKKSFIQKSSALTSVCLAGSLLLGASFAHADKFVSVSDKRAEELRKDAKLQKGDLKKVTKAWLKTQYDRLGLINRTNLNFEHLSTYHDKFGKSHLRYQPIINNIPVEGRHILVRVRTGSRVVLGVKGDLSDLVGLSLQMPKYLGHESVEQTAIERKINPNRLSSSQPELVVYQGKGSKNYLAWKIKVINSKLDSRAVEEIIYVDSQTNKILSVEPQKFNGLERKIYDDQSNNPETSYDSVKTQLSVVRNEGSTDSPTDSCLNSVYNNMGVAYNYFFDVFGLNSFDGEGGIIHAVANYTPSGNKFHAAFHPVYKIFVFGPGSSSTYGCTATKDIASHEYTHAVVESYTDLKYVDESAALHESIADVFGAMAEAHANGGAINSGTWTIGEEAYYTTDMSKAIRSMKDPDKFGLYNKGVSHYDEYDNGPNKHHKNSGIGSHAFYLLAQDEGEVNKNSDVNHDDIEVTGIGHEDASDIWFHALMTNVANKWMDFANFRGVSLVAAYELPGINRDEFEQVVNSWAAVGVGTQRQTSSVCESSTSLDSNKLKMIDAYLAIYGRPGDIAGVKAWGTYLGNNGGDIDAIIDAFATSNEYTELYTGKSESEIITETYENLFGRTPSSSEVNLLLPLITGNHTINKLVMDILENAVNDDLDALNQRREVAYDYYKNWESTLHSKTISQEGLYKMVDFLGAPGVSSEHICSDIDLLKESLAVNN